MKPTRSLRRSSVLAAVLLALPILSTGLIAEEALDTEEKKSLYALGVAVGQNLSKLSLTAEELKTVQQGLTDMAMNVEPKVNMQEYGPKLQGYAQARMGKAAEAEKAAGMKFLDEQAAKEGAMRKDSGLIITEITPGTGASPAATDTVTVHYHGTLRDGTVFDSSVDKGEPATFPLNQVIGCWTEGVQLMKVGGKSRLVCPPDIAYGDAGPPGIPGGATLVFEVELIEIAAGS
ncbi:MAG: FKBP-type peptidyl-prolyl cis-trans isomerase [bacterium]|nr:FKBP-type peptidyl-prolyl cis-trans isomerase [bacterium]